MIFSLFITITLVFFFKTACSVKQTNLTCSYNAEKARAYLSTKNVYFSLREFNSYSVFSGFSKFSDLILQCANIAYQVTPLVEFVPNAPAIIDNGLEKLRFKTREEYLVLIIMVNVRGIENSKSTTLKLVNKQQDHLILAFSDIDFYLNNTLITKAECHKLIGSRDFFSKVTSISMMKVKYPKFLCPTIFKESSLKSLRLSDISQSLLKRNPLNILGVADTDKSQMHVNSIERLELDLEYVSLDAKILSKFMFCNVKRVIIKGTLLSIETRLFSGLNHLRSVMVKIDNLKDFLHQDNSWMTYLNEGSVYKSDVRENKKHMLMLELACPTRYASFNHEYNYPDEDFCQFKDFPHSQVVIPMLAFTRRVKCSCTIRFLVKNNWAILGDNSRGFFFDSENDYYYNFLTVSDLNGTYEYCHSRLYNETEQTCDFNKMLSKCANRTFLSETNQIFDIQSDTDLLYLVMWVRFVFLILLQPALCVLGNELIKQLKS